MTKTFPEERLAMATYVYHVGVDLAQAVSLLQLEVSFAPGRFIAEFLPHSVDLLMREVESTQ